MSHAQAAGTLDRAMRILRHLASVHSASTAELAEAAQASRSATYRIVATLAEWGLLQADDNEHGRWVVGPEAVRLGVSVLQRSPVAHVAPEPLRHLVELTQETGGLAIAVDVSMAFLHREPGPRPSPVSAQVGALRPMHGSAVGKAWLAAQPADVLNSLLPRLTLTRHTPASLTSRTSLERDIELARRRGWSQDLGETHPLVGACGAVVRDARGVPVAAISLSGPLTRIRPRIELLGPVVITTADLISRRLGMGAD